MAKDVQKSKRTINRVMIDASKDDFYGFDYDVVKTEYLNFFDPKVNSNKFYVAEVHSSKSNKGYRLYINYGRNGDRGVENAQAFNTLDDALRAYEKKIKAKLSKGYQHVDIAVSTKGSEKAQNIVNENAFGGIVVPNNSFTKNSALPLATQTLIKRIYDEANQAVSLSLNGKANSDTAGPLGNIGINGINRGRRILRDIACAIREKDEYIVEQASITYYTCIPRKLSSRLQKTNDWLINSMDRVQRELDTLDLYEDTLRMLPIMGISDVDKKYAGLNCDLGVVSKDELEYIKHKIATTHAHNHRFRLEVTGAWAVNQHNAPKLNDSCGNVVNLFHGSRSANIVGILSSRLKLPNTLGNSVIKTGAMFGPGIYLASDSTKSANYSFGTWCGRANKYGTAYLFIVASALGNVYKVDSSTYFNEPPYGYHSVMGVKGRSLINNEFIVYREDQVRIKYIVEVKKV